jgi:hypothetical protein
MDDGTTGIGVPLHALFQQRLSGDHALLELTRLRFEQAGLAAEVYAGAAGELDHVLRFTPPDARPPMVHLPRDLDLLDPGHRARVADLVRHAGDRVSGFVLHDRRHLPQRPDEVRAAAAELDRVVIDAGPARLYLEYAAGLQLAEFTALAEALRATPRLGVCIDSGHVGNRQARRQFAARRPDLDLDLHALTADHPRLPELVDDVAAAVAAALPDLLDLIGSVGRLDVPVHLHLHDGHPLAPGLADHFGFLTSWPIPVEYHGRRALPPLYGPAGLESIVTTAVGACHDLSITLEIHQWVGRRPLLDAAPLFGHWRDLEHAERTDAWLAVIGENAALASTALATQSGTQ